MGGIDRKTQQHLGFSPERLANIDAWMADHVESGRLAGLAVQISRRGEIAYSARHGLRDIAGNLPVEDDTIWRIYSMTKPLTTVAALMLYEEGAFQLDQPVADFIPAVGSKGVWKGPGHDLDDIEELARPVTVHDLMTHQSGFLYGAPKGDALEQALAANGFRFDTGETMADALTRLCDLPLAFQPGARWSYGYSTDVLGRLVEVISGKTLGEFFRERILDPLGMTETGFGLPEGLHPRVAKLYAPTPEGGTLELPKQDGPRRPEEATLESGGGGLLSTMGDFQRFASAMLARGCYDGGRLLGRKTFDSMVSNHMGGDLASRGQAHFSETTFEGIGFGLGVSVMLDPAKAKIIGSPGEYAWGGMASTAFWVDPAEEMTVILMTQLAPSSTYTLRRQLRVLSYQALVD
ncbi:serine hydrolase domain-containing protein [Hwanghaeella sp.]|uniref:serine hydrolase domain-containing protein n=1 Tax=Hwanghaeella sp. TaxID=2605943 RepID=UPI003CCC25D0